MEESSEDLARRALKAALAKLESDGTDSASDSSPFVVLVVGVPGSSGSSHLATPALNRQEAVSPVDHPGLEKFPINEVPAPSPGQKPCFMEPDRVCVSSGACEMRGF